MASVDLCHSFAHPPIVPFFSLPKKALYHIFHIPPFIPLKPPCFPSLHFLALFSPLKSALSSAPLLPSRLPVSLHQQSITERSLQHPQPFHGSFHFSLKSLHALPLSSLLLPSRCLILIFFPSLHTHPSSSDSNFTVIYGNPSSKSSSQRQPVPLSLSLSISIPQLLPSSNTPRSSSTSRLISPPLDQLTLLTVSHPTPSPSPAPLHVLSWMISFPQYHFHRHIPDLPLSQEAEVCVPLCVHGSLFLMV